MRRITELIAIAAVAFAIITIIQRIDVNKVGGMTVITFGDRTALLIAPTPTTPGLMQCLPPIRTE